MWSHQFKLALRNFLRYKLYTLINLFGLSIGIAVTTLILLWVNDELSFDTFHKNYPNIYRIVGKDVGLASPKPMAPIIDEEIPEIIHTTRLQQRHFKIEHEKVLYHNQIAIVDNSFFKIFSFPFTKGDSEMALKDPGALVMCQSMAKKLFGNEMTAIGKNITLLVGRHKMNFNVSGIFKDIPTNSHLQAQCFISVADFYGGKLENWDDWGIATYVQTVENSDINLLITKINHSIAKHDNKTGYEVEQIQPLQDIHLYSSFPSEYAKTSSIRYVYLFSIIALVILAIACINYVNLTISQAVNRTKEVGIKKVFGATKNNLIKQFTSESLILVFFAGVLALILIEFLTPLFNSLTGKALEFSLSSTQALTVFFVVGFIGLIVGIFPSFYISSFNSISIMKSDFSKTEDKLSGKKILLIGQFTLSIIIIIVGLVIAKQISFVRNMDMGFDKTNLVTFNIINDTAENINTIKNELLKKNEILECTAGNLLSSHNGQSTSSLSWKGKPPNVEFYANVHRVDHDFLKTHRVKMKEGRFFSESFPSDKQSSFIINETAAKSFNIASPVGKAFTLWGVTGNIVGVINDYFFESAHEKVAPVILWMNEKKNFGGFESITLRIKSDKIHETIAFAKATITQFNDGYNPDYHFIDSRFDNLYHSEKRLSTLFNIASGLGISISCVGLLALVSISAKRKSKEISIRKIMGASVCSILNILLKETVLWVSLGFIIACPLGWYVASKWLQNFAYRTILDWWIFVLAGILAVAAALLTASYHTIKAARSNPVEALRYE